MLPDNTIPASLTGLLAVFRCCFTAPVSRARIADERMYDGQRRRHVTAESGHPPSAVVDILAGMAIARLPLIAIDCPDPGALARFYGAMLDWKIDILSADRASVWPRGRPVHRLPSGC
jgi:hypothetical protein